MIFSEFRILGLSIESQPQNTEDYNSFSDLFSDYLNTINHLNLKLLLFIRHIAILQWHKTTGLLFLKADFTRPPDKSA